MPNDHTPVVHYCATHNYYGLSECQLCKQQPIPAAPTGRCCNNGNFGDGHKCLKQPAAPREAQATVTRLAYEAARADADTWRKSAETLGNLLSKAVA